MSKFKSFPAAQTELFHFSKLKSETVYFLSIKPGEKVIFVNRIHRFHFGGHLPVFESEFRHCLRNIDYRLEIRLASGIWRCIFQVIFSAALCED